MNFERIDDRELVFVERTAAFSRRWHLTPFARAVSRLGNGWLYPLVGLSLAGSLPQCVPVSAASVATSFAVYPLLKRSLARLRPCEASARLNDPLKPLDRYSFPSGHAMTAAAVGLPILLAAPSSMSPFVIAGCAIISWSRVALGHHYFTDILAGTFVGAVIAGAFAIVM